MQFLIFSGHFVKSLNAALFLILSTTATLASAAPVGITCAAGANASGFGSYDRFASQPIDNQSGSIEVSCSASLAASPSSVSYTITLSPGFSNSYNPRTMRHVLTGAGLNYNLYTTSGYNIIWGDGVGGTQVVAGAVSGIRLGGGPAISRHTIYGRLFAGQNVAGGGYGDSINVGLTY
jgi:spore coat protein U-like protein